MKLYLNKKPVNNMKKILFTVLLMLFINLNSFAQNKGFIPDSCSYSVLSQPSRVTKNAQLVYGNNFRFPFLMSDGTMLLLSNDEVKDPIAFSVPDEIKDCEKAFILDNLMICKYGKAVESFDGKKVKDIFAMPNEQYNIYPANDGFFYFVKHKADSSFVYLFEKPTKKFSKLFETPFLIDNLSGTGQETFVTSGEMIYFVSEEICSLVEVADSKVQSIDFYSEGAFFSTEKACYYMGLPGKSYPFLLGNIKQVMLVDNRLYLLFSNGLLSVIDHADQYQTLLDVVINKENKNDDEKR